MLQDMEVIDMSQARRGEGCGLGMAVPLDNQALRLSQVCFDHAPGKRIVSPHTLLHHLEGRLNDVEVPQQTAHPVPREFLAGCLRNFNSVWGGGLGSHIGGQSQTDCPLPYLNTIIVPGTPLMRLSKGICGKEQNERSGLAIKQQGAWTSMLRSFVSGAIVPAPVTIKDSVQIKRDPSSYVTAPIWLYHCVQCGDHWEKLTMNCKGCRQCMDHSAALNSSPPVGGRHLSRTVGADYTLPALYRGFSVFADDQVVEMCTTIAQRMHQYNLDDPSEEPGDCAYRCLLAAAGLVETAIFPPFKNISEKRMIDYTQRVRLAGHGVGLTFYDFAPLDDGVEIKHSSVVFDNDEGFGHIVILRRSGFVSHAVTTRADDKCFLRLVDERVEELASGYSNAHLTVIGEEIKAWKALLGRVTTSIRHIRSGLSSRFGSLRSAEANSRSTIRAQGLDWFDTLKADFRSRAVQPVVTSEAYAIGGPDLDHLIFDEHNGRSSLYAELEQFNETPWALVMRHGAVRLQRELIAQNQHCSLCYSLTPRVNCGHVCPWPRFVEPPMNFPLQRVRDFVAQTVPDLCIHCRCSSCYGTCLGFAMSLYTPQLDGRCIVVHRGGIVLPTGWYTPVNTYTRENGRWLKRIARRPNPHMVLKFQGPNFDVWAHPNDLMDLDIPIYMSATVYESVAGRMVHVDHLRNAIMRSTGVAVDGVSHKAWLRQLTADVIDRNRDLDKKLSDSYTPLVACEKHFVYHHSVIPNLPHVIGGVIEQKYDVELLALQKVNTIMNGGTHPRAKQWLDLSRLDVNNNSLREDIVKRAVPRDAFGNVPLLTRVGYASAAAVTGLTVGSLMRQPLVGAMGGMVLGQQAWDALHAEAYAPSASLIGAVG